MKVSRRAALAAIGSALLLSRIGAGAADVYPAKPVRLVVAWPPGSSADTSARLLAQKLGESLGQSFIVDNRPGASGIIGTESVLRAPADGYTLLFNTANHASNKVVFPKLSYDPVADFVPVSMVHRNVLSVSVHPSLPVKTLEDFLQYAKAKPGTLSFGTPGLGTPHQLAGELLKQRAGIDMVHIPYKGGGPAVADLLSGQIPVSVASLVAVMPFMRTGRVRVVAVTDPTRYDEIKDVAAVAETFSGFDVSGWSGLFALAGTPPEIVARLNAEVTRILSLPDTRRSMNAAGLVASVSTPEALGKLVRDDIERWMLVVKSGVRFS